MASTLTVRIDDGLYAELSRLAAGQGVTLSDLARRTLNSLITPPNDLDDDDNLDWVGRTIVPPGLTTIKRHELALQHRIAAQLFDGDEQGWDEYHRRAAKVFERGYVLEYSELLEPIYPELPRHDAKLVMDILDMCLHLERNATKPNLRIFDGFDANDRFENRLRDYARFLIDQGKWEALALHFDEQHEHGNSHGPRIAIYRRMLAEFAPIWERKIREMDDYKLTAAEVQQVLDARVHPSNRPTAG